MPSQMSIFREVYLSHQHYSHLLLFESLTLSGSNAISLTHVFLLQSANSNLPCYCSLGWPPGISSWSHFFFQNIPVTIGLHYTTYNNFSFLCYVEVQEISPALLSFISEIIWRMNISFINLVYKKVKFKLVTLNL